MEIKKIAKAMDENNIEEIFDVTEEACYNDCTENKTESGGRVVVIKSSKTTYLF